MTGHAVYPLAGPSGAVWDPTGARIAAVVREGAALIRVGAPEVRIVGEARQTARSLGWSPDGESIAVAYEELDLLRRVRVADGVELWRAAIGQSRADEPTWSPDGRKIACRDEDIVVCDAATGTTLWRAEARAQRTVVGVAARTDDDGRLRPVERVGFTDERAWPHETRWSPDSTLVAARWDGRVSVLDGRDGATRAERPVDHGVVRWGPWGEPVYSDGALRLALRTTRIDHRRSRRVHYSDDGRRAAAEGEHHCLWIEDEDGPRALAGHPRTIEAIAWSSTGELATACRDGQIRRVPRGGDRVEDWTRLDATRDGLSWSPDGAHLAVCCRDALVIVSR